MISLQLTSRNSTFGDAYGVYAKGDDKEHVAKWIAMDPPKEGCKSYRRETVSATAPERFKTTAPPEAAPLVSREQRSFQPVVSRLTTAQYPGWICTGKVGKKTHPVCYHAISGTTFWSQ
jgi:hypothetical protein